MIRRLRWWLADKLIDWPILPLPIASKLAEWIEPEPEVDVAGVLEGLATFAMLGLLVSRSDAVSKLLGSMFEDVRKAVSFAFEPPEDDSVR